MRARLKQSRLEKQSKRQPSASRENINPSAIGKDIEDIDCADVLSIYLNDVGEPGDQFEIEARIDRLNDFWAARNYRR